MAGNSTNLLRHDVLVCRGGNRREDDTRCRRIFGVLVVCSDLLGASALLRHARDLARLCDLDNAASRRFGVVDAGVGIAVVTGIEAEGGERSGNAVLSGGGRREEQVVAHGWLKGVGLAGVS